jgi:hypothetical protein
LIYEVSRKLKLPFIQIDLLGIKSEDDLCRRMIKAIISFHRKNDSSLMKILKQFSSLRPNVSIDPMSNMPSVGLSSSVQLTINDLESAFDTLIKIKKCFIFFDEFQDILSIENSRSVMSVMRSNIQKINNKAFVFSGSIRNQMINIFSNEDEPFYKSSFPINLESIKKDDLLKFLTDKFSGNKIKIEDCFLEKVVDLCGGIPGDIMRLCEGLVFASEESRSRTIDENLLSNALEHIYSLEKGSYELMVQEVSKQQLKTLVALAENNKPTKVTKEFVQMTGIALAGSVNKAMKSLVDKRIVTEVGQGYKFSNPFFKSWLLTHHF